MALFKLLLSELNISSTDNLVVFFVGFYHEVIEVADINIFEKLSEKLAYFGSTFFHEVKVTTAKFSVKPLTPVKNLLSCMR